MKFIDRRHFLGATTIAAASTALAQRRTRPRQPAPQAAPIRPAASNPNRRLGLGLIGCGWWGMQDLKAALQLGGVDVLSLCDVDSEHLQAAAAEVQKLQGHPAKTFKDYRELLQTPGLEAVIIATPPHWHALPFLAACEKGIDIYCEKPLAYDVREGRAMVNAAMQAKRVVQIGFQRRNSLATTQAAEYIKGGYAGRIIQAHAEINYTAQPRDTTIQSPPPSLDWDLWCGPAPLQPYNPNIGHIAWRLEAAYGNGHLVDWGIHWIDAIRTILGATVPESVQAMGGLFSLKGKITTPDALMAQFDLAQCPVTWSHRIWGTGEYTTDLNNCAVFYGEKETVYIAEERWAVIPKGKNASRKVVEAPAGKMSVMHMANFLEAVRTRQKPTCDVLDGYYSTTAVQLAMIAYRAGTKVRWNSQKEQIVDNPSASALLKRPYRPPYKHPGDSFS
ncbi:MAG: Gfo/Idh/MocA family protein [Acidobacteriota bacterium]